MQQEYLEKEANNIGLQINTDETKVINKNTAKVLLFMW